MVAVMFQGTASDAGKSILTSALCRILRQEGYQVAPFKSQNMALNSYVTPAGGEIGRAQAVQAEAAQVEPSVDMNPILLKPNGDSSSQVIVHGKPRKNMSAREYFRNREFALKAVRESLQRLQEKYEVLVIEGAGSPAEVNLREYDIVNMKVAELAAAPVILVANIEHGGVFASIVGTFELLNEEDRNRIKAVIINKFRGQVSRLQPGIEYIEEETGAPVLGVVPYLDNLMLPEEDTVPADRQGAEDFQLNLAVIKLPRISNFTDFDALGYEPRVRVTYVEPGEELADFDMIFIPGSKNTIEDLAYLYQTGCAREIMQQYQLGTPVAGICGGYQMLGRVIHDPRGVETEQDSIKGLGLLDIETTLLADKVTWQVEAEILGDNLFAAARDIIDGYEIHMGRTERGEDVPSLFKIVSRAGKKVEVEDGACSNDGRVWGTYLHGLFASDGFRREFINHLRRKKGLNPLTGAELSVKTAREAAFNKLADTVRENLNMELLSEIIGL